MKSKTRIIVVLALLTIVSIPLIPSYTLGWKADDSDGVYGNRLYYNTHQWLAWEAVSLFPDSQMSWITNNLWAFWLGVEAPYNGDAAADIGLNASDYGKIHVNESILYLDATGTTVTNDTLATYANAEYDNLVIELQKDDTDYELAAFYAGAMSHYVSQAGVYGAIWNETIWGPLIRTNWATFENIIETGSTQTYLENIEFNYNYQDMSIYDNQYFDLTPTLIGQEVAYDATIDLAMLTHPYGESMQNNLNISASTPVGWTTAYRDNVTDCLTFSVEAIYASLAMAMNDVDWSYLSIPKPVYAYDNVTHHIQISDFEVTFTNETNTYTLNDTLATNAEVWYVYYDDDDPDSMSTDGYDLAFNDVSQKWYYDDQLAPYTQANTNHSMLFYFDMDRAAPTWGNLSTEQFYVEFYNTTIPTMNYYYNVTDRSLDVWNVTAICHDIPEINNVSDTEIVSAKWFLYQKGAGSPVADAAGIQVVDTIGNDVLGDLIFDGNNWSSYDNDIGLVFSAANSELYVLIRFILIVPAGYYRYSEQGGSATFIPFIQRNGIYVFRAKDHDITISKPVLEVYTEEVDGEIKTYINSYGITAFSDYNDTELNNYEINEKEVHGYDRREARWKVFLFDGIPARLTGSLIWNDSGSFWYVEGVEVGFLPDNKYYLSAKIVNMNTNFTTSPWGPGSDEFAIKRPMPVLYFILPEFFLAGFIVLFGWLAWYRPRKKKQRIEAERVARLEKIYD